MHLRDRPNASFLALVLLAACSFVATLALAQESTPEDDVSSELAQLARFEGAWTLTEHHYDAMGKVIARVKGTEEISWVLDKHAIRRTYTSTSETSVFRAIGLLTWNQTEGKYHGTWLDNVSRAGPTIVKGDWDPERNAMVFRYSVTAGDRIIREFNVIERFVDDRTRIATTFELTGGAIAKRTEVEYKRAVPCPDKLRIIREFGG